ncbi:hypothetical protein KOR42_54850 [Thalassoglobus neptunius]|uniref:Toprim domain-containing protein n=1 Tax=Thalassoglobus neptunius TaxID=1938619 RepID=A0A5C5UU69_9PLAN|nr:hypothetical protein [Thalassoglobus neptunius]TWT29816.1 hypothetical protein KOR42_54850 [Thalassoglobus neptunius]
MVAHVYSGYVRVTAERCCPVCRKPDWCLVSRDGGAAICPRISEGAVKDLGEAGWLHLLSEHPDRWRWESRTAAPPQVHHQPEKTQTPNRLPETLAQFAKFAELGLPELAEQLGLSIEVLRRLNVGYCKYERCWSFPERDASGTVTGLQKRYRNGEKRRLTGTKAGLTYPDDWDTGSGPLLLVEGASDVAAAMLLGLSVVGRPSNRAGVNQLAELLVEVPEEREIVVLGERDQKPSGLWPGKDGAISTATKLAKQLQRPVGWSLPPDGCKDLREWLNQHGGDQPLRMQHLFLQGLHIEEITPPPKQRLDVDSRPVINDDQYRKLMVQVRTRSLDRPGIYLDRSGTGHGKSTVDFEVIVSMISPEESF